MGTKLLGKLLVFKLIATSTPILIIADPNEYFIVSTYACKEGIGGILTHNGHVICYEFMNIKDNEKNYTTHDLEFVS